MVDAPPLQQSTEYAAALARIGRAPLRLADGTLVVTGRIAPGLRIGLVSRAALPARDALCAAGLGRMPLLVTPDRPGTDPAGALRLMTPLWCAALDLSPGSDRLWAGLHQKWRNRVRHARRLRVTVVSRAATPDTAGWLLDADAAQGRARGYRGWPRRLTLAYAAANPGQARLFTATRDGAPVAALMLLRHAGAASYHIAHATAAGRAASAPALLLWSAIAWLSDTGAARLDLGTVNTEDAPGLARFKLGTGATARPLGASFLCWPPLTRRRPRATGQRQRISAI